MAVGETPGDDAHGLPGFGLDLRLEQLFGDIRVGDPRPMMINPFFQAFWTSGRATVALARSRLDR